MPAVNYFHMYMISFFIFLTNKGLPKIPGCILFSKMHLSVITPCLYHAPTHSSFSLSSQLTFSVKLRPSCLHIRKIRSGCSANRTCQHRVETGGCHPGDESKACPIHTLSKTVHPLLSECVYMHASMVSRGGWSFSEACKRTANATGPNLLFKLSCQANTGHKVWRLPDF